MKILILDPEDQLPNPEPARRWDLVLDLARAPASTYSDWSRQVRCPVVSVFNYAQEIQDLYLLRELLQLGVGEMLDRSGIDWWDVLSLEIAPQLKETILMQRVARDLDAKAEWFVTRPSLAASILGYYVGKPPTNLQSSARAMLCRIRHQLNVVSELDLAQLRQIAADKLDKTHALRRKVARRKTGRRPPVVLLPSAYRNVSSSVAAYAAILPEQQFLMTYARKTAQLRDLPRNVSSMSLDSYFGPLDREKSARLLADWDNLKLHLRARAREFEVADGAGIFDRMAPLLRWGAAVRDAWQRVFDSENISACLCADDSNPYTRIPLILAKLRGIPALACHHGALDGRMVYKIPHADLYLAKSEMEQDYLVRIAQLSPERVVVGAPQASPAPGYASVNGTKRRSWLVFFTEPYEGASWRTNEIYRQLLPRLFSLAQKCGLRLVLKLHPFESVRNRKHLLKTLLPAHEREQVDIVAGPIPAELWGNVDFAITVESTIALECVQAGVPVFLCSWLRSPYWGYVQQFSKFQVGRILESPEQLDEIPDMLESWSSKACMQPQPSLSPKKFRELLSPEPVSTAEIA